MQPRSGTGRGSQQVSRARHSAGPLARRDGAPDLAATRKTAAAASRSLLVAFCGTDVVLGRARAGRAARCCGGPGSRAKPGVRERVLVLWEGLGSVAVPLGRLRDDRQVLVQVGEQPVLVPGGPSKVDLECRKRSIEKELSLPGPARGSPRPGTQALPPKHPR